MKISTGQKLLKEIYQIRFIPTELSRKEAL